MQNYIYINGQCITLLTELFKLVLCTGIHCTEIFGIFPNDTYRYSDFSEPVTPKIGKNSGNDYGKVVLTQNFHISATRCLPESYDLWIYIYRKFPTEWQYPNLSTSDTYEDMKDLMLHNL